MNSSWMGIGFEVVRSAGETTLYSRRQNVLNEKFYYIAKVLKNLPDDTVVDGELVALLPMVGPISISCRTSAPQSHPGRHGVHPGPHCSTGSRIVQVR